MELKDLIATIPDWAKDVRLSVDTIHRTKLEDKRVAWGSALAAAISAERKDLADAIAAHIVGSFNDDGEAEKHVHGARVAAGLMSMTNYYYSFRKMAGNEQIAAIAPGLRMQAYASHGGVDKKAFEAYALAASVVGKCEGCVSGHVATLLQEGMFEEEVQEVARIASAIGAAAKMLAFA